MRSPRAALAALGLLALVVVAAIALRGRSPIAPLSTGLARVPRLRAWLSDPGAHPSWAVRAGPVCGGAPFLMPTTGYVGYLWDDSFRPGHRHQGIDVFGGTEPGVTPVVAAHDGYVTRRADWVSTVAVRAPSDPLRPGRPIWTYYTHMATADGRSLVDAAFPPGTAELPVQAGTILGRQGDYSGDPARPVGVHLHFSVVLADDAGGLRNESVFANTVDPLPYLGLAPTARGDGSPVTCRRGAE